ncbi:MAG: methyltransferase domain-containing protein [Alteraurantiacibacter sp.]
MSDDAWNNFWQRDTARGGGGTATYPAEWRGVPERQRRVWHSFARRLPQKARVLDIASGAGVVLGHLREARPDLALVGVDQAQSLPHAPAGTRLIADVAMEHLPFDDCSFDAVTSQFGFEYGDMAQVAREVARVLSRGGQLGLLSHRKDGPIVAHNRARAQQLAWAIEQEELTTAARKLVNAGHTVCTVPPRIADAPELAQNRFGPQSAAWQIAEATRRALAMHNAQTADALSILDGIEAQAHDELGRIRSLSKAAEMASDAPAMLAALGEAGLEQVSHALVTDGQHPAAFADYRILTLTS